MLLYFGDRTQLAGLPWYTGSVSSTETTALTFTGNDSEYFFSVLEPHLVANEICAGAKIIIRQGLIHREVHIPVRPEMVNQPFGLSCPPYGLWPSRTGLAYCRRRVGDLPVLVFLACAGS
jgi:hypothetical protein